MAGGDLYAGGAFTQVDGIATCIAKWDGSSWSTVGSGIDVDVYALAVSGDGLYAGGAFPTPDRIAKWNGRSWSALGSGLNNDVWALAVSGSDLYAGGYFTTAGGKLSPSVARAYLDLPSLSISRSGGDMTLSWPVSFGGFALQQNPDAANTDGWSDANYPLTTNGATKGATVPLAPTKQFFRLIGN